jgi:transcriptional regulator
MKEIQTDLLQGTLDLLVLKTLQTDATHGWDIAQRIQQVSGEVLRVGQGSLYPALHRLEERGWIRSEWGASDNNRRARFYKLNPGSGSPGPSISSSKPHESLFFQTQTAPASSLS